MTSVIPSTPLGSVVQLVLDSVPSPQSKRAYGKALADFLAWYRETGAPEFSKATVQAYRSVLEGSGLAPSSVNVRLSAVRKLALEAADNGLMNPHLAEGIGRVKNTPNRGKRLGNWLTKDQAQQLLDTPNPATMGGKRDRALLGVLLGCGLRRDEAARLTFADVQMRDARWVLADIRGKGQRVRTVPMPSWAKVAIDEWRAAAPAEPESRVFRPVNRGDHLTPEKSMTAQSVYARVKQLVKLADLPGIAAHDLRRTYAKLARKGGSGLDQIQLSLGHSSIKTTEGYVNEEQDLTDAPCDHLGIRIG